MIKINFKQPKYIFPLVIFVPLCALIYFVMQTFGGSGTTENVVATDRINMELPEANAEEAGDKMYEMARRFGDEDAFTAVGGIGEEDKDEEKLEHGYSEEELNSLDAAEAERIRQQQELEELERSLAESRRHINSQAYGNASGNTTEEFAVTSKRYSVAAMKGRKPSKADWATEIPKRKRQPKGSGRTPLPKPGEKRRNVTVPIWSSSHPIRTQASSIRSRLRTMWWKPS